MCNLLPRPGKTESPLSKFSGTSVQPNLKHFHPFGCPVYILQAPLQTRSPFPKWGECSRIGIFLCHSPHHASSVPLVLSTQTGLLSPQFHCVFDNDFDTVKKEQANMSIWKTKTHLQEAKERAAEVTTRSLLVSGPKYQLATSLPPYAGTSHKHSKTCPNFFQMPLPQWMVISLKILQPLQQRSQQVRSKWKCKTLFKARWSTTNRKHDRMNFPSSLHPWGTPEPAIRSTTQPGLHKQPITANIWPKLASSPSSTSTRLPAFGPLHQPLPNQMDIQMQCPSTWQCNNPTVTSSFMPWHVSWSSTQNSSTGRSFTSPKV